MKPTNIFEAEASLKDGQIVYALDFTTWELFILKKNMNRGFIQNMFTRPHILYYVVGETDSQK